MSRSLYCADSAQSDRASREDIHTHTEPTRPKKNDQLKSYATESCLHKKALDQLRLEYKALQDANRKLKQVSNVSYDPSDVFNGQKAAGESGHSVNSERRNFDSDSSVRPGAEQSTFTTIYDVERYYSDSEDDYEVSEGDHNDGARSQKKSRCVPWQRTRSQAFGAADESHQRPTALQLACSDHTERTHLSPSMTLPQVLAASTDGRLQEQMQPLTYHDDIFSNSTICLNQQGPPTGRMPSQDTGPFASIEVNFANGTGPYTELDPKVHHALLHAIRKARRSETKRYNWDRRAYGTICMIARSRGEQCRLPNDSIGRACDRCVQRNELCIQKTDDGTPTLVPLPLGERKHVAANRLTFWRLV